MTFLVTLVNRLLAGFLKHSCQFSYSEVFFFQTLNDGTLTSNKLKRELLTLPEEDCLEFGGTSKVLICFEKGKKIN